MDSRIDVLDTIRELSKIREVLLVEQGLVNQPNFFENVPAHAKDIDFWTRRKDRNAVHELMRKVGGFRICHTSSSGWLNHDIFLVRCFDGILLIDVTIGDLMVGPVTLATECQVTDSLTAGNRFSKLPLIADLLLRPLARGNRVADERLNVAIATWSKLGFEDIAASRKILVDHVGKKAAMLTELILCGADRQGQLIRALRARTARNVLNGPKALSIALRKIALLFVARVTGRTKPFGRHHRGLLIALSGTDGVGKSTAMGQLRIELEDQQIRSNVYYLGRGRGNLPGLETLRSFVGKKVRRNGAATDVYRYSPVNKAVSWYYAFEYFLRTLRPCLDAKLLGKVVLCDRYIYDIRLIPGYSQIAAGFAEAVCPTPDINVFLTAPADVIQTRKKERTEQIIKLQQDTFATISERKIATFVSLSIDTRMNSSSTTCKQILTKIYEFCHINY